MNGPVGGRIEPVAPRAVTDAGDRRRLLALVALSVLIHVWLVANTAVTAKDSIRFARMALALWKPNEGKAPDAPTRSFPDVLRAHDDPPGYPLALAAFYFPVKAVWPDPHSTVMDRALLAGQVASSFAAVLTVFPLYWLGRLLFSKRVGFWAAGVFQCLPVYARESADALSDAPYLLFVALALLLAARGVRKPTVGRFLLAGLPVGVAYLIRPEGLFVLLPCLAVVPVALMVAGRWTGRTVAACLAALAVGVAIPAAPYVAVNGRLTNKPSVRGLLGPDEPMHPRQKLTEKGAAVAGPPFASWISPDATGVRRFGLAAWESLKEWLKATHYSVAVLSVLGLILLRRQLGQDPALWVPLVFGGVSAVAMGGIALRQGYISERHGLPLAMVGTIIAVAGLEPLWVWAARNALFWNGLFRWPRLTAAVCVLVMLSGGRQLLRPLHDNRLGHKLAGKLLWERFEQARSVLASREATEADKRAARALAYDHAKDTFVDPYGWAEFYSGWAVFKKPEDPQGPDQTVRWAVLELVPDENGVPQPDEPKVVEKDRRRYTMAAEIYRNDQKGQWEQVFVWPAADTGERPRVVLVKQTLPPKPKQ